MKIIWQPTLEAERLVSDAERALQCQISRGFKSRLEKEVKREKILDAIAKGISDLILGCVIFGGMAVALYFGSK